MLQGLVAGGDSEHRSLGALRRSAPWSSGAALPLPILMITFCKCTGRKQRMSSDAEFLAEEYTLLGSENVNLET